MFQKGDYVIYGDTGVCRIEEVEVPKHLPVGSKKLYYKLIPVYEAGTIYIPVDTKVFMRAVISREEAIDLISKIPFLIDDLYETADPKAMVIQYKESIQTHNCGDLLQMIRTAFIKNRTLVEKGRKESKINSDYMKRAEKLLHGEFSIALGIPVDQVQGFIEQEVSKYEQMNVK